MPDQVLKSKLVGEKIEVIFDFTDELAWGETILSAVCSVDILVGVDTAPNLILSGQPTRLGRTVKQKFYQGLPGCIYTLACEIVGSTGAIYRKASKLAILPQVGAIPPVLGTYFTTPPYPVEVTESVRAAVAFVAARLREMPFPRDGAEFAVEFISGDLFGGGKAFSIPTEAIEASVQFVSGNLFGGGKAFSAPPESAQFTVIPVAANLFGNGLEYQMQPIGIQTSVTFQSGTLE